MHKALWLNFLAIVFVGLALSAPAHALVGHWRGAGTIKDSKNLFTGDCSLLEVKTERTQRQFILKAFVYKCGLFDSDWIGLTFDVRDGKLYDPEEGTEMGKISDQELLLVYQSSMLETLHLVRGDSGSLKVDFNTRNMVGNIQIRGDLLPH
ncbi:MAG TPA: hypothetical protein VM901_06750 [Bdellovibrionota bacterium]|jgi:hypothetical protein|nr:hypothetical protein [Bdellovibrionota bacterium]